MIPLKDQIAIINTFNYMPFEGKIALKKPDVEIGVFEEFRASVTQEEGVGGRDVGEMRRVWMGRKVFFFFRSFVFLGGGGREGKGKVLTALLGGLDRCATLSGI